MRSARLLIATSIAVAAGSVGVGVAVASGPPSVRQFAGVIHLTPGACHHGRPTGSYLAVTFGTRAIRNSDSSCDGGAVTLLSPQDPLSTRDYATVADATFSGRSLRLETARESQFDPPGVYLIGTHVVADVRSVLASYGGGQWPVGAERATGSYNPASHALSLQWFSGQSFTRSSAGTEIHLAGTFSGVVRRVREGSTVELGTASFAAGGATPVVQSAAQHATAPLSHHRSGHLRRHDRKRLAAAASTASGRSPKAFLVDELLVLANLVAFIALVRRRGRT